MGVIGVTVLASLVGISMWALLSGRQRVRRLAAGLLWGTMVACCISLSLLHRAVVNRGAVPEYVEGVVRMARGIDQVLPYLLVSTTALGLLVVRSERRPN